MKIFALIFVAAVAIQSTSAATILPSPAVLAPIFDIGLLNTVPENFTQSSIVNVKALDDVSGKSTQKGDVNVDILGTNDSYDADGVFNLRFFSSGKPGQVNGTTIDLFNPDNPNGLL